MGTPEEEGDYTIQMTLADDRTSFEVRIESSVPMEDRHIIMAIEEWLYNNLLDGQEHGGKYQ